LYEFSNKMRYKNKTSIFLLNDAYKTTRHTQNWVQLNERWHNNTYFPWDHDFSALNPDF
jgi:hypothetical protein